MTTQTLDLASATHGYRRLLARREALAKWVHPQLFAKLDPQATLEQINQQFLGMPLQGAYWIEARTQ